MNKKKGSSRQFMGHLNSGDIIFDKYKDRGYGKIVSLRRNLENTIEYFINWDNTENISQWVGENEVEEGTKGNGDYTLSLPRYVFNLKKYKKEEDNE